MYIHFPNGKREVGPTHLHTCLARMGRSGSPPHWFQLLAESRKGGRCTHLTSPGR